MKKILISIGIVVAIALYAIFATHSNTPVATPDITLNETSTQNTTGTPTTTTSPNTPNIDPIPKPKPTAAFKDGSYTGPVTDAIYGNIQVVAIINNGRLSNIQIPVYPTDGGHTTQVSQSALPQLKQEAITAQSANVDIISGATQTSEAFIQSLAAALTKAKA